MKTRNYISARPGRTVTVSAPGKVILMGDHAVVYGKPAIAAAINKRMRVSVRINSGKFSVDYHSGSPVIIRPEERSGYIRHTINIAAKTLGLDAIPPMTVSIESEMKPGYHLGTSAAVAVSVAGAFIWAVRGIWNPVNINRIAYEAEKKIHGNPSGVDNTAVTSGGLIWYRRELEFLKSIWQLPFGMPDSLNHFYLVDTGKPGETTGEMVSYVRSKYNPPAGGQSSKYNKIFDRNELETKSIAVAIKAGNEFNFIKSIRAGQRTLEEMGVVSPRVLPAIRAIEDAGGAAKTLGGGGRKGAVGYLLAYIKDEKILNEICRKYGYPHERITLGAEGVKLETK
jgi:mevalonate kinase